MRHAAGYIPRKLITQLQRTSHLLKDELIAYLQALSEDLGEMKDESEDWVDAVDRGGLVHVTYQIYRFFCAMECACRVIIAWQPENLNKLSGRDSFMMKMYYFTRHYFLLLGNKKRREHSSP